MQKTLESFIDPANIPIKYGGQLDFKFGDLPILDPILAKVTQWEDGKKDFPHGPMYWTNKKGHKVEGKLGEGSIEIAAHLAGSVNGELRTEEVCTVTRTLGINEDIDGVTNGHITAGTTAAQLAKLNTAATVPVEDESNSKPELQESGLLVPTASMLEAPTQPTTPAKELQEGELVPATRPEPERFVTAHDGGKVEEAVKGLSLNEKSGNLDLNGSANGNGELKGPHATQIANLLDPNVAVAPVGAGLKVEEAK